jgi:hypothetical protein
VDEVGPTIVPLLFLHALAGLFHVGLEMMDFRVSHRAWKSSRARSAVGVNLEGIAATSEKKEGRL